MTWPERYRTVSRDIDETDMVSDERNRGRAKILLDLEMKELEKDMCMSEITHRARVSYSWASTREVLRDEMMNQYW
jgi:hypothetical protein